MKLRELFNDTEDKVDKEAETQYHFLISSRQKLSTETLEITQLPY